MKLKQAFNQINKVPKTTKLENAGYDNARENIDPHIKTKVLNTSEAIIGREHLMNIYHAYGGYNDVNYTLTCDVNTWTKITNATSDLWTGTEADGLTLLNDQITIINKGDYIGSVSLTISAVTQKDFHLRIYNVTQAKIENYQLGVSTTGAGNNTIINLPIYIEAEAGDVFELQIRSTDETDPILNDAIFYISYLHD